MTVAELAQDAGSDPGTELHDETELRDTFEALRRAFRAQPYPSLDTRKAKLRALRKAVLARRDELADAIRDDFGNRSRHESLMLDVFLSVEALRYTERNLAAWMAPEPRSVPISLWFARASIQHQPLGVIGVISPWNYPAYLALVPVATALAAGNRVMVKPSEMTPRTSELLRDLLLGALGPDWVGVVPGDADLAASFARLPFDHLLFTGSTRVGRLVMQAAAENLTPVTLELGGKSPAILHPSCDRARTVERIGFGKLLNAGQTCIAPDYALVPQDQVQDFVSAFEREVARRYPTLASNPDYTSIIDARHLGRLQHLLDDACFKGARLVEVNPAEEAMEGTGKLAPHLLLDVSPDMAVMQEEIFGPILPIIPIQSVEQAIEFVNERPRPLVLYYFDASLRRAEDVIKRTHSGGVVINDTMLSAGPDDLAFGGVGPSGMGRYHGREGFVAFSNAKGVVRQSRVNFLKTFDAPYGKLAERILDVLLR